MPDLKDGESTEMQGSGAKPYVLKNTGGVYSCSCPAWRNQSNAIEQRTCKHLRKLRGDTAEEARIGGALPQRPTKTNTDGTSTEDVGPPLLLAESWDNATDLSGWWMSEKLDGVRAYWDPGNSFREGLMLRQPGSKYTPTVVRSVTWLAIKSYCAAKPKKVTDMPGFQSGVACSVHLVGVPVLSGLDNLETSALFSNS